MELPVLLLHVRIIRLLLVHFVPARLLSTLRLSILLIRFLDARPLPIVLVVNYPTSIDKVGQVQQSKINSGLNITAPRLNTIGSSGIQLEDRKAPPESNRADKRGQTARLPDCTKKVADQLIGLDL